MRRPSFLLTLGLALGCGEDGSSITVMTYNIRHDVDWSDRGSSVVAAIGAARADVVALQEALLWQVEQIVTELPDYAFVGRGRDPDGQGESVAILYRRDRFEAERSGTFWFSDEPEVQGSRPGAAWGDPTLPRIATWVRLVEEPAGRAFYVYNVHLQHDAGSDPELARVRSMQLLAARIHGRNPKDPFVVAGDFNAVPSAVPIRYLVHANPDPIRYCSASGGSGGSGGSGARPCEDLTNPEPMTDSWDHLFPDSGAGTYPCPNASRRIDYVFVAPGGQAVDARIEKGSEGCASDHMAVVVRLRLPRGCIVQLTPMLRQSSDR